MTDNLRKAAEMALEALVKVDQAFLDTEGNYGQMENEAYNAACDAQEPLRQALAEPYKSETAGYAKKIEQLIKERDELRKALAQSDREWVGLTDVEICAAVGSSLNELYLTYFRKVIAKLKEKNKC